MGQNLTGQTIASTYEDLVQISGSILTDGLGNDITNLTITASTAISASFATTAINANSVTSASYASTANSASYALTASYALNAPAAVDTGSLMVTGSVSSNTLTFTKGDGSTFNLTVATGSATTVDTGSLLTTASISDATITFTKGDASTFNIVVNNVSNASTASIATTATTASYASTAASAESATSASYALTASYAANVSTPDLQTVTNVGATTTNQIIISGSEGTVTVDNYDVNFLSGNDSTLQTITWTNSGFTNTATIQFNPSSGDLSIIADGAATFAGNADTATSASYATTASHALGLADGVNINVASITASAGNFTNITATSASIGFLQTVTGSATIIGDAFIILNTSDAQRYAGLIVEDSGSATPINYTASYFFDSLLNDWNYEYTTTSSTDFGVALFGPTYNTKGSPTYLTANKLTKAEGTHHLVDSSITDDGSTVLIEANTTVSTTGATADLVVTSDDDFTYQSTLRIGGGAGGAGNGFYLSNFNDTSSVTTDNGLLSIALGGTLQLQGLNYPSTDGNAGEFLATDGAGNLSFVTASTATSASYATTASFAVSASWAPTPATPNLQEVTTIGASTSASIVMSDGIVAYNTIQGNGTGFFIQSSDDSTDMLLAFADSIGISTGEVRFAPTTGLLSMYADNGIEVQSATTFTQGTTHTGATTFSSSVAGVVNPLTISSQTASMDCSTANFFTLELPNAATHLVASNIQAGQTTNLRVTHTSTSSGSLAFSDSFLFAGGTAFEVTPATSSVDVMTFISFNGSTLEATGLKNFS